MIDGSDGLEIKVIVNYLCYCSRNDDAKLGLTRRKCLLRDSNVENTNPTVYFGNNKREFKRNNFYCNK